MINHLPRILLLFSILCLINCKDSTSKVEEVPNKKPNILFIAIDDLRPELGVYGNPVIRTPNIDNLANDGILFENAYVQQAVCNPSRASLMTGLRPDATKVWDLWTQFRDRIPNVTTLPQHFKQNGYHSVGIGKLYHNIFPDTASWSEPKLYLKQFPFDPDAFYVTRENLKIQQHRIQERIANGKPRKKDQFGHYYIKANATEIVDGPDSLYYDGAQTLVALKKLDELASNDKPFFFGVGYYRPHLPFNAPKKYWDLYNENDIEPATNTFIPKNVLPFSVNNLTELKGYTDFKDAPRPLEGSLKPQDAKHLKHGYYASVSYIDVQVGMLIKKLKELNIYENTIIVLWGDHGYKLGEHNAWAKFTNYIVDNHVPLIIKSNDHSNNKKRISQFIEFVDIYPTLCDMAEIEIPENLQGLSQLPIMNGSTTIGKETVFFQYLKESIWSVPKDNEQMGYSVLTADYHYVKWVDWNTQTISGDELYILDQDPNENENVASYPENAHLVEKMSVLLNDNWQKEQERVFEKRKLQK